MLKSELNIKKIKLRIKKIRKVPRTSRWQALEQDWKGGVVKTTRRTGRKTGKPQAASDKPHLYIIFD
jgi:hypothetical protein